MGFGRPVVGSEWPGLRSGRSTMGSGRSEMESEGSGKGTRRPVVGSGKSERDSERSETRSGSLDFLSQFPPPRPSLSFPGSQFHHRCFPSSLISSPWPLHPMFPGESLQFVFLVS